MSEWSPIGKWLVALGLLLVAVGLLVMVAGKIPFIGRLPGDIRIERENFNIYFPLTTCLALSVVLSLVFMIVSRFK